MTRSNLDFVIRTLPDYMSREITLVTYRAVVQALRDMRDAWPQYVSRSRKLVRTAEGRWVRQVTIGNGPRHTVINVVAHGGEPLWVTGSTEYGLFLCEHPWLLEGRTVHLLYADPVGVECNIIRWAIPQHPWVRHDAQRLAMALCRHWRHPVLLQNDCWSYPFQRQDELVNEPTPGAVAGMMIMHEIAEASEVLELWVDGHNRVIGDGVQFLITGPYDAATAFGLEEVAKRNGLKLDSGPAENPSMRRHPGTIASWTCTTATDMYAHNPVIRSGGNAYDYGVKLFPEMTVQATEVGMFRPCRLGPWDEGVTWEEANRSVASVTSFLRSDLDRLSEIAAELKADDRYVSATKGINESKVVASNLAQPEPRDPHEILEPAEAFQIMCRNPLYLVRRGGPALEMIRRHRRAIAAAGHNPTKLAGMLTQAMNFVIGVRASYLERQPLYPALLTQILAAEVSAYGSRGIHLTPAMR